MSFPNPNYDTKKRPIPKAWIDWKNMCGPVLYRTDGGFHWLTLGDEVLLALGLTTVERMDKRPSVAPYVKK